MKKTKFLVCLLVVFAAFLLVACGNTEKYTVSFETNGGSVVESIVLDGNGTLQAPADPTKEGHKFLGWYLDEACEQEVTDFAALKISANTILYAKWQVNSYTVTFNTVGGSSIESATVKNTNATETARRFEREWKNFSVKVNSTPITKPRRSDSTTSRIGSTTIESTSTDP